MIILTKSPSRNKKIALLTEEGQVLWPYVFATYRQVGPTCPSACGFHPDQEQPKVHGRRCYATVGNVKIHSKKSPPTDQDGPNFYRWLQGIPPGCFVRLHVSGDFFLNNELDEDYWSHVRRAFEDRGPEVRGWVYTHADVRTYRRLREEAPGNLTVNISCDSLAKARRLRNKGVTGVTCVLPTDATRKKGVVICPYATHKMSCVECKICMVDNRKAIVGFPAE